MHDDPRLVRELMVLRRDALHQVKLFEPIPVVVDHDMERKVGTVRPINVFDDVVQGALVALWYFAHCDITDPPGWLERGGGVSWCHNKLSTWEPTGVKTTVLASALVHEISILTPATEPAEPLACVSWVGEIEPKTPAMVPTSDRAVAGEVIYGTGELIRRDHVGQVLGVR
jgi:hypothetical protein